MRPDHPDATGRQIDCTQDKRDDGRLVPDDKIFTGSNVPDLALFQPVETLFQEQASHVTHCVKRGRRMFEKFDEIVVKTFMVGSFGGHCNSGALIEGKILSTIWPGG